MAELRLAANGKFDPDAALLTLDRHGINGMEITDLKRREHIRLLAIDGNLRPVTVGLDREGVLLRIDSEDERDLSELAKTARFWFDLDADLKPVEDTLGRDPVLGRAVRRQPGLRIIRYPDGYEAAIRVVLGQQVSVAAGNTFAERLVGALGRKGPGGLAVFPAPARLLEEPADRLRQTIGLTRSRTATLQAVAALFAAGFRLGPGVDPSAARSRLSTVRGVGPWTVGYLSIRGMADPDLFPEGDAVLRRALGGWSPGETVERSERWAPWRSYAAVHLWQAATAS